MWLLSERIWAQDFNCEKASKYFIQIFHTFKMFKKLKELKYFKLGERGILVTIMQHNSLILLFCSSLVHFIPQLMHFFLLLLEMSLLLSRISQASGFLLVCLPHRAYTHPSMPASVLASLLPTQHPNHYCQVY